MLVVLELVVVLLLLGWNTVVSFLFYQCFLLRICNSHCAVRDHGSINRVMLVILLLFWLCEIRNGVVKCCCVVRVAFFHNLNSHVVA